MENTPPNWQNAPPMRYGTHTTEPPLHYDKSNKKVSAVLSSRANSDSNGGATRHSGLFTPPSSQVQENFHASQMLISPPPEEVIRSEGKHFIPSARSRSNPPIILRGSSNRLSASSSKRKRPPMTQRPSGLAQIVLEGTEPSHLERTPNPKPRKLSKRHAHTVSVSSQDSPTRSTFPMDQMSPQSLRRARSVEASAARNSSRQSSVISSSNAEAESSRLSHRGRSSRRSATPIPPYEPPAEQFTPPREIILSTPTKAKAPPRVSKSSKRKSAVKISAIKAPAIKPRCKPLKIIIKQERPHIDLSLPLPPPSPTDDPLLLTGPPIKRWSKTATNSHTTPSFSVSPEHTDYPAHGHVPDFINDASPEPLPALNISPIIDSNGGWSDSDSDGDVDMDQTGDYTGRFKVMRVPTKLDPPTSGTKGRIDAWGRPISPYPNATKLWAPSASRDEEVVRIGGMNRDLVLDAEDTDNDVNFLEPVNNDKCGHYRVDAEVGANTDGLGSRGQSIMDELPSDCDDILTTEDASKAGPMSILDTNGLSGTLHIQDQDRGPDDDTMDMPSSPGPSEVGDQSFLSRSDDLLHGNEIPTGDSVEQVHQELSAASSDEMPYERSKPHDDIDNDHTGDTSNRMQTPDLATGSDVRSMSIVNHDKSSLESPDDDSDIEDSRIQGEIEEIFTNHLYAGHNDEVDEEVIDRELSEEPVQDVYDQGAERISYLETHQTQSDDDIRAPTQVSFGKDVGGLADDLDSPWAHSSPRGPSEIQNIPGPLLCNNTDWSSDDEEDTDTDVSVVKIVSGDPKAAARATAILKMYDYECLSKDVMKKRRSSHPTIDSVSRDARRKSASDAGIRKSAAYPGAGRQRRRTLGGVIGDKVFMPGSPVVTLPDLLREAESGLERSSAMTERQSPVKQWESVPDASVTTQEYDSSTSSLLDHEWSKGDWKALDACFTDERLDIGGRFVLGDVDNVQLDNVVKRFTDTLGGEDAVYALGPSWSRDKLLARARALQKKQRAGKTAAPSTPFGLPAPSRHAIQVPDFTPLSRRVGLGDPEYLDLPNIPGDRPLPLALSGPRYSHLMEEAVAISKRTVYDSQDSQEPMTPVRLPTWSLPSQVQAPTSIGGRFKGLIFSYLPTLARNAAAPRKFEGAHPGLPLPPPEILSKPRGPIATPDPKPIPKATHPKELVQLQHAPLPTKRSMIPTASKKPRRLVDLRPARPRSPPTSPQANQSISTESGRRSSAGSVRDLVKNFEERDASIKGGDLRRVKSVGEWRKAVPANEKKRMGPVWRP